MRKKILTSIVTATLITGCASTPPPAPFSPAPEPTIEEATPVKEDLTPIYEQLDLAGKQYLASMDPANILQAESLRKQATENFSVATELCGEMVTCTHDIITEAYAKVIAIQTDRNQGYVEKAEDPILFGALPPDIPTIHRGESLSDIADMNGPIKEAVRHWLVNNRSVFIESYVNFLFLEEMIQEKYDVAGLPLQVGFGMGTQESNFKIDAVSHVGAAGMWQFMRDTAAHKDYNIPGMLRHHPELSTEANTKYLLKALEEFNDDMLRAIASYNWGINRRILRGEQDYWQIESHLPSETRTYVRRILGAIDIFNDIRSDNGFYNITLPAIDPTTTTVNLQRDLSLGELQACMGSPPWLGSWMQTLRNLNPEYGMTPFNFIPVGATVVIPTMGLEGYEAKCVDSGLVDYITENRPKFRKHLIRSGDSYGRVGDKYARECGITQSQMVRALRESNPWKDSEIPVGKTMIVPCKF